MIQGPDLFTPEQLTAEYHIPVLILVYSYFRGYPR